MYRRRGLGRHPLDHARQSRDRKPLNSADATYDMGMSGVYARNVAFEPSSSRRRTAAAAACAVDDDDSTMAGGAELDPPAPVVSATRNDNEYEYVWDASAVASRAPKPGQLHRGGRRSTEPGGGSASTSFGGGRASDQCRCMTESVRTLGSQGHHTATAGRYPGKPAAPQSRHRGDKAATLGRFGHLESRSAARSGTGKGQHRQGRGMNDPPRRVCPHCGHQSSSPAGDGAACAAGTPPARPDTSLTMPRRQTSSHRRA